ncbi:MAG: Uma2 family endonuclease [Polyangiaceae bacterium]
MGEVVDKARGVVQCDVMQAMDVLSHARPRLLSRAEYDRMVAEGMFANERVELIRGILVEMSPIGSRHADPVDYLNRHFVRSLGDEAVVRVQQPFAASDDSEPEPDLALVPPRRYSDCHPDQAFLIIEVSDESLGYDRETKGALYAASGVPEYWIVDVRGRVVEVHDRPQGGVYERVQRFTAGDRLAPAAFPAAELRIDELFV